MNLKSSEYSKPLADLKIEPLFPLNELEGYQIMTKRCNEFIVEFDLERRKVFTMLCSTLDTL